MTLEEKLKKRKELKKELYELEKDLRETLGEIEDLLPQQRPGGVWINYHGRWFDGETWNPNSTTYC